MSSVVTPRLQKYENQILSLVPYSSNDRLDFLIRKLLPDESSGRHLAVQNEIKRLAQQTNKKIDLSALFDNCELVEHNNISHQLDPAARDFFYKKLNEYQGLYTIDVYREVLRDAQDRANNKDKPKAQTKANTLSDFQIDKTEPKPLINKNRIETEEKNLNSSCKVFTNPIMGMTTQGKKEIGISATIDKMTNRKVVIHTMFEIPDVKANKIFLWLYDHHKAIEFTQELELGFEILDSQKLANKKTSYLLKFSSPLTDKQMRILFRHYLKQKQLAVIGPTERFITPLFDSITSKGYEQLYLNKTHDIPLLCYKNSYDWQAKVALKTSGNDELWHFFSDEQRNFHLPILLGHQDIKAALNSKRSVDKYAFILKSTYLKNFNYSLMWFDDWLKSPNSRKVFNSFFKNGLMKVIKISSSCVNAEEDAYVPSALPCHVHPKMAVLNRPTPKAVVDIISDCDHMLTVSDITSLYETIYHPIDEEITEVDPAVIKKYVLPKLTNYDQTEIVTAENDDSRSEDRFIASFKVAVTRSDKQVVYIPGRTKNISVGGLLVSLNRETKFKAGEEIEIELTVPFASEERTLKKQKYVILGYDSSGAIRLLMNEIESKHLASKAIRKYIHQNIDSIEACGKRGSRIYGLQKAMRNIYAHNHFSIPFYLKTTKHQQYINAASFSGNSALKHLVYQDNCSKEIILNLLSNKKFRDSCLSIIGAIAAKDLPARAFYILVLPKGKDDNEEYSFIFRDLSVLQKSAQLQEYTKMVSNLGKPAVLKVELKKSNTARDMYYRDEISYLKGLDKDLAQDIETQIKNTIGIGEVTDLTDISLAMINNAK